MPGFENHETLSGTKLYPPNEDSTMSLKNSVYEKEMQNNMRSRLLLVFLNMSSKRKMDLLTNVFQQVRNIRILADTLNTFFSVNTKLISYSKISTDSNSLYEQFLHDDNRIMDTDTLEEYLLSSIEWFKTLEDTDQTTMITSLLRVSGGSIIKKMYVRLVKIFNKRNSEEKQNYKEYTSTSDFIFSDNCNGKLFKVSEFQPRYVYQDEEKDYNPDCPTSKKVMDARKQWQASMAKVRKEIEVEVQKLNEPIIQRMKQTSKEFDSNKPKGSKVTKNDEVTKKTTITKIQENYIDWIQFLPLWSVKKIFSYLDEKTLQNLKNVNNYWATISKEVLTEKKAREYLNTTIKKSEVFLDNLMSSIPLPPTKIDIREGEIITEPSGYKKRMEKQRRTGTFLRKKKEDANSMQNKFMLSENLKEIEKLHASVLNKLLSFPIEDRTVLPKRLDQEADKSGNVSINEVTTLRIPQIKRAAEQKSPSEKVDTMSSTSSIMSLVPSIVVSVENMKTW